MAPSGEIIRAYESNITYNYKDTINYIPTPSNNEQPRLDLTPTSHGQNSTTLPTHRDKYNYELNYLGNKLNKQVDGDLYKRGRGTLNYN